MSTDNTNEDPPGQTETPPLDGGSELKLRVSSVWVLGSEGQPSLWANKEPPEQTQNLPGSRCVYVMSTAANVKNKTVVKYKVKSQKLQV